ncbi:MAG: transposase-like protein [Candidatus Azotimanducaceae bacterium]
MVDQNYTVIAAAKAMNVGISTMAKWVDQLKQERQGKPYAAATPMTPDQLKIRELEKRIARIEMEKEILKKGFGGIKGSVQQPIFSNRTPKCYCSGCLQK